MIVRIVRRFLAALLLTAAASASFAGDFFETNGVALRGYDPVAYFTDGKAEKGVSEHSYVYQGSKFLFATAAHEQAFAEHPEKYAPQFGGFCSLGTANGVKVSTEPDAFAVVDGKLYLNHNARAHEVWKSDVKGNVAAADKKWPEVSKMPQQD
jgi:YHS domain-containing protein